MLESNKRILDRLDKKQRLLKITLLAVFLLGFIYLITEYGDKKAIEYRRSIKKNMTGVIVNFVPNLRSNICFIKLGNGYGVMLQCVGTYNIGQQIDVVKTTKPSGEYYYEIKSEII